jgi:hypothetical protein
MNKQSIILLFLMGLLCTSPTVQGWRGEHCGPDRLPYDPNKRGCCYELQPDGTYKWVLTGDPENVTDPCSKVPSGGSQGQVICYNGNKYICIYPENFPSNGSRRRHLKLSMKP